MLGMTKQKSAFLPSVLRRFAYAISVGTLLLQPADSRSQAPQAVLQKTAVGDLDISGLAPEIRASLDNAGKHYDVPLKGAKWSHAFVMSGSDRPLMQIQGLNAHGRRIEIVMTGSGRVLEVSEHEIPFDKLPNSVSSAVAAKMPKSKPVHVEAIYQAAERKPSCYGFEFRTESGKKSLLYVVGN